MELRGCVPVVALSGPRCASKYMLIGTWALAGSDLERDARPLCCIMTTWKSFQGLMMAGTE